MTSPAQMPEQAPPPPVFVLLYEPADDVAAKAPAHFRPTRSAWMISTRAATC